MNEMSTALDQMRHYRKNSVVKNGASGAETEIRLGGQITVGKFLDIDRPYLPAPPTERVEGSND
jgi:hypothetical protein